MVEAHPEQFSEKWLAEGIGASEARIAWSRSEFEKLAASFRESATEVSLVADWNATQARKYRRAMWRPWEWVELDPPTPLIPQPKEWVPPRVRTPIESPDPPTAKSER